ncbi:MAG: hypothetical protein AB7S38_42675 [Vulcanimicrobiota bacterium]
MRYLLELLEKLEKFGVRDERFFLHRDFQQFFAPSPPFASTL